jgi:hypothetical protein
MHFDWPFYHSQNKAKEPEEHILKNAWEAMNTTVAHDPDLGKLKDMLLVVVARKQYVVHGSKNSALEATLDNDVRLRHIDQKYVPLRMRGGTRHEETQ